MVLWPECSAIVVFQFAVLDPLAVSLLAAIPLTVKDVRREWLQTA